MFSSYGTYFPQCKLFDKMFNYTSNIYPHTKVNRILLTDIEHAERQSETNLLNDFFGPRGYENGYLNEKLKIRFRFYHKYPVILHRIESIKEMYTIIDLIKNKSFLRRRSVRNKQFP